MARHSKNNTSNSVFSYAEYKKLDYGTKRQRIGVDSMRERLGCALCLQRAREPVACSEGHLYCKECIYTDLLEQKKEIKRQQATLEQMAQEEEQQRQTKLAEARERVLKDFEVRQLGLGAKKAADVPAIMTDSTNTAEKKGQTETPRGTKRKFDFDQDEVDTLARKAEEVALRQIEKEQAESRRAKLPAFWLPSLTPDSALGPLKDIKLQTLCHAVEPAHTLSLKSLVPVTFTFATGNQASTSASVSDTPTSASQASGSQDAPDAICPSCKKQLSNSSIAYLIRSCSHVVCKTCVDTLVKPAKQCVVCDKKAKDKDIVELAREGTGYAAGGRAETTKASVAFQG